MWHCTIAVPNNSSTIICPSSFVNSQQFFCFDYSRLSFFVTLKLISNALIILYSFFFFMQVGELTFLRFLSASYVQLDGCKSFVYTVPSNSKFLSESFVPKILIVHGLLKMPNPFLINHPSDPITRYLSEYLLRKWWIKQNQTLLWCNFIHF